MNDNNVHDAYFPLFFRPAVQANNSPAPAQQPQLAIAQLRAQVQLQQSSQTSEVTARFPSVWTESGADSNDDSCERAQQRQLAIVQLRAQMQLQQSSQASEVTAMFPSSWAESDADSNNENVLPELPSACLTGP